MTVSGTQPDSPRPAIERDGVETAASSAVSGLSGSRRDESESESGQDDSGHLRARRHLAALIAGTPGVWSTPTRADAETIATAILAAGYRRVSVDDATVERVARAMWFGPPEWTARIVQEEYAPVWRAKARAAVQALRDGGEQP